AFATSRSTRYVRRHSNLAAGAGSFFILYIVSVDTFMLRRRQRFLRTPAIFERSNAECLAEHPTEILRRVEAAQLGHAGHVGLGARQELTRTLDAQSAHVLLEGHLFALDEEPGKVVRRK